MPPKPARRTAERILEAARALYNRFGEPHVATAAIAQELGISPGNLHYHYPAKQDLLERLAAEHAQALAELLAAAPAVQTLDDAWLYFQLQLELAARYHFLFRDLDELISRHRALEQGLPALLQRQQDAADALLDGLATGEGLDAAGARACGLPRHLVLVQTAWFAVAYARAPRQALEDGHRAATLHEGVCALLGLLAPWLPAPRRALLLTLLQAPAPAVTQAG